MRARDVMTKEVSTLRQDATVGEAIHAMRSVPYSGFPVVDGDGRAVGLVSQNDLFRALVYVIDGGPLPDDFAAVKRKAAARLVDAPPVAGDPQALHSLLDRPVRDVMTAGVTSCGPDDDLADVCATMVDQRIHRVVVVDGDGKVIGLVSATDVVRRFGHELRR